jgi:tetratricopeptide (TPR) repeat protein
MKKNMSHGLFVRLAFLLLICSIKTSLSYELTALFDQAYKAQQEGDIARASHFYSIATQEDPTCVQAWYNLAHTFKDLNRIDVAIEAYQKVLIQEPEHVFARFGLGQCYGSLYAFEKAFPLLEHRGNAIKAFEKDILYLKNLYDTHRSLKNMRIILRAEWGLGDNIQFIRYAQLLHDQGAHIIMHSYPQLKSLFKLCPYIDQVISEGDAFPPHHLQIPLLSLPYVCQITQKTCTPCMPYLKVSQTLIEHWRSYLASYPSCNVGISWQGNGDSSAPPLLNKNIPVKELACLADVKHCTFFNLQKNAPHLPIIPGLVSFDASFDYLHGGFMDTAALMQSLDLIITIDTSIAHLAGALNRPVWLLLPYHSDWRWGIQGQTSPFYPSIRLFRQKEPGNWQAVMREVVIALKEMAPSAVACRA